MMIAVSSFADALAAVSRLKEEGVVSDYAVGGAMAMVFWSEPVATFDLDVFVRVPATPPLVSLAPIYDWARSNGFATVAEHIEIAGIPVQFIPAPSRLAEEAIETAAALDYEGLPVRVIRPEYLIGLYLEPSARTAKRLQRVAVLLEEAELDRDLLHDLVARYELRLPAYE